jgi:hypothetical protein
MQPIRHSSPQLFFRFQGAFILFEGIEVVLISNEISVLDLPFRWKVPESKQRNKYTMKNMQYYLSFLLWIRQQDPARIKFLDECHFQAKGAILYP